MLLLTDADAFAGTERHMLDLAAALRDSGDAEPVIGCPADTPLHHQASEAGLAWSEVPRPAKAARRTLRALVKAGGFDLIHAHNGRSSMLAALAGAGGRRGCALGSTLHFISLAREGRGGVKGLVSRTMHGWLSRRTAFWIAISDVVASAAAQRDPGHRGRVTRVYNGVVEPVPVVERDQTRERLGITPDQRLLLTVNRLETEKGTDALIGVAKRLEADGVTGWRWLVAGSGSLEQALREQIASAWPGGEAPIGLLGRRDDVPDLMSACDALVHPAPAEPFGLVLAEAMALGRAVIASTGGAAPEIVRDGETGLLFAAGDAGDLQDKVGRALTIPCEQLQAWGERGRARYEAAFTAERMARETAAVYRAALRGPREPLNSTRPA